MPLMFKEKYCVEVAMKIYSTGIIAHEKYGNAVNVFWTSDDYSVFQDIGICREAAIRL